MTASLLFNCKENIVPKIGFSFPKECYTPACSFPMEFDTSAHSSPNEFEALVVFSFPREFDTSVYPFLKDIVGISPVY